MSATKYFPTQDEISLITRLYDGKTPSINKIMRLLDHRYPRWYVRRKAQEMGLARAKEPNWSEKEVEYLHKNFPRKGFVAIQNDLKRINGGVCRSITAIVLKKKREHINKRSDGFTMRMVEDLLGADHHKIEAWVNKGWLKDGHKGTLRTPSQGGDMHHFEAVNLRDLVINHYEEIDLRWVEKFYFIQLVAGML
jgi:hypothetical protein